MKTFKRRATALLVVLCLMASIIPAPASFAKAVELGSVSFALRDYESVVSVKTDVYTTLNIKDAADGEVDTADVDISYVVSPEDAAEVNKETGVISTLKEGKATVTVTVTPKAGGTPMSDSIELDIQKASENLFTAGDFEGDSWLWNRTTSNWRILENAVIARDGDATNKAMRIFMDSTKISESGTAVKEGNVVTVPQAGNIFLKEGVAVYPGRLYQMSYWIKTADFANGDKLTLSTDMYYSVKQNAFTGKYNNAGGVITYSNRGMTISKTNADWTQVTLWICAPLPSDVKDYMDGTGKIYVSPYITARATENATGIGGTVYIDDIEIREVGFDSVDVQMGTINQETDGTTDITITPLATTGEKIGIRKADFTTVYKANSTNSSVIDVANTVSGLSGNANGLAAATGSIVTKGYGNTTVTISATINGITREWKKDISIEDKSQTPASATLELADYESRVSVLTDVNTALTVLDGSGTEIPKAKYKVTYKVEPESAATVNNETGVISTKTKGNAKITATVTDTNGQNPISASCDIQIAESSDNLFAAGDFENAVYADMFHRPAVTTGEWRTFSIDSVKDSQGSDTKALGIHFDGNKTSEAAPHNWTKAGIKVHPGKFYEMSFWAKTENFANAGSMAFNIDMPYSTAATNYSSANVIKTSTRAYALAKTNGAWQKYTLWVAAPIASDQEDIYLYLYFSANDSTATTGVNGDFYIDDIEIREVGFEKLDVQIGNITEETDGKNEITVTPLTTTGAKIGVRSGDFGTVYKANSTNSSVIDVANTVSGLSGNANGLAAATGSIVTKGYGNTTVTIGATLNGITKEWTKDISLEKKVQVPTTATLELADYETRVSVLTKAKTTLAIFDAYGESMAVSKCKVTYKVEPEDAAEISTDGVIYGKKKGAAKITAAITDENGQNPISASCDIQIAESSDNLFAAGDFETKGYSDLFASNRPAVSPSGWRKFSVETKARENDADNKALHIHMDSTITSAGKSDTPNTFLASGIPVYPGKLYEMSYWVKAENLVGASSLALSIDMYYSISQTGFTGANILTDAARGESLPKVDGEWHKVTRWIAAPVKSTQEVLYVTPYISANDNDNMKAGIGGDIYIDDIQIREVGFEKIVCTPGTLTEVYLGETEIAIQPIATTGEEIGIMSKHISQVYEITSDNDAVDTSDAIAKMVGNDKGMGETKTTVVTTGIGKATVTVACTLDGERRETDVELDMTHIPNSIKKATLTYEKSNLIVGDKIKPTLSVKMIDGTEADLTEAAVTYATSNPNIVAINSKNGMIAAIGEGNVTITATVISNGVTITGRFDVTSRDPGELESVELYSAKDSISRGETMQLEVSGKTTNGNSVGGENLTLTYSVSEGAQYASVDSATGVVTGVESGTVTIKVTATLRGGDSQTDEIVITINDRVDHKIKYIFYEGASGNGVDGDGNPVNARTVYQASNWSTNAEFDTAIGTNNRINNQSIGIQVLSTNIGQWLTFRIQVDRAGWYTPTLTTWAKYPGGILRSYITKPATSAGNMTAAQLEELRSSKNSVGVITCYVGGTDAVADYDTVKMRTVHFPEPGEYALTLKVEAAGADGGYRMFPASLELNRVAFVEATAKEALPEMYLDSIIPPGKRWVRVGGSASFAMMPEMEDGSYEDLVAADSVTAQSSDDTKLKAEVITDANGYKTLKLTGLEKALDTTVTLTVKLNGVTYTKEIEVPVTVGQKFDFKNYNTTGDDTKTPADALIGVDGWQASSASALSYNADSGIVADTTAVGQDVSFKVNLDDSGWYQLTLDGGKYPDGGVAGVYIDGYYVGEYDFSGDGVAVGDGEAMRALNLAAGEHTVTLRTTGTNGTGYKMYIGSLDFVVLTAAPTLAKIIATTDSDDIPEGSSAGIRVVGVWSDGAEQALLPKLDGSADGTYTLAFASSNEDVATVVDGVWYAHGVGDSDIQISVTPTGGQEKIIILPVAVNEKAWVPEKTQIFLAPEKFYEQATVTAHVKALLGDGSEIPEETLSVVYTSSDEEIFTVNDNILTGVKKGEATLTAVVTYSGKEETFELPVTVLPKGFAEVIVTAEKTYVNTGVDVALSVSAKTNTGEAQDLTGAIYVYESLAPTVASVSQDGVVTTIAEGNARIKVTVTLGGGDDAITNVGEISIGVTNGKTRRSYYTDEKVANARENIQTYTWAKKLKDTAVANAEKYIDMGNDRLWAMVPGEGLARSWMIGYTNDPMGYNCPHPDCGVDLRAEFSTYPWKMDPINDPWKIQCPACRRRFPSNDFGKFYELGLDEHGVFDIDLAYERNDALLAKGEEGYLVNKLYPELGEGWGVDDGLGWKTGKVNANNVIECKTFIGYYIGRGLWLDTGIITALTALRDAYLYTGEAQYGRAGAILVDRIADLYPDFCLIENTNQWWLSHGGAASNGNNICLGKIEGRIQDCATAREFVYAYDAFFPAMEDEYVISFLKRKAEQYKLDNKKKDAWSIRQNSEDGILREIYEACKAGEIYGNFGMHQATLGLAAIVLDRMPETGEWIDYIMQPGVYTKPQMSGEKDENGMYTGKVLVPGSVTGGNVENTLIDNMLRDGSYSEAAPGYNKTDITYYCLLIEALNGYDKYEGANLYEHPATLAWFKSFAPLILVRQSIAELADTGVVQTKGVIIEASGTRRAFEATGDPMLAQLFYARTKSTGDNINNVHSDIWVKNPEKVKDDILKVLDQYGELDHNSEMANGIGFAILRDGDEYDSSITAEKNNFLRDFWMYYGTTRGIASHGHAGVLNLGIEAYGLNMAPELGYPEATGASPHRVQWTRTTLSHNTVVVNEEPQARNDTFSTGTPLHFDDVGRVKLMDVDAWNAYPNSTDIYRRTVVMIQASDEVSYGLDFFRVKGGDDHIYSFHSLSDTVSGYSGVDFTEQKIPVVTDSGEVEVQWAGSYAGVDRPWGADENDPNTADVLAKRGYTWLGQVRKDTKVEDKFNIDFKVTDFRKILPYEKDLHMNVTMLNRDLNEVTLATSIPPQKENNPKNLEYMLARRSGSDLDTLFTAAYEPYEGKRYLKEIDASTEVETAGMPFVEISDGAEGADDKVQLVRVTFENGRVDYVIYATNNHVKYTVYEVEQGEQGLEKIPLFDFRGFVGVYTMADGRNTFSYVNDGDLIAGYETTSAYTGSVVDFTKEFLFNHSITVRFDIGQDVEPAELVGRYIYIENDGPENAAYLIKGAEKSGRNIVLDIGAERLITKYKDANDTSKGYVYNIEEGAAFRLPLSYANDTAPEFKTVGEQSAVAGKRYSLKVNATTSIPDVTLTYSARSMPRGASFDPATATISWTPDNNQIGTHNFAIDVTDGGSVSTLRFEIEVYKASGVVTEPVAPPAGGGGGGGGGDSSGEPDNTGDTADGSESSGEGSGDSSGSGEGERFIDLGGHAWAKEAVYALVDKGVINGTSDNTYSPASNIKRADFAIMLVRAFGISEGEGENFADVDASKYYAEELRLAKAAGIVKGVGNNKFNPEGEISRQDMMLMLERALEAIGYELEDADESVLSQFTDAAQISDYAKGAVASLVEAGAIAGSNGRINPLGKATRAEVAVMLGRILLVK